MEENKKITLDDKPTTEVTLSIFQKLKRWWLGMGKEFKRIQWTNKKQLIQNLIIVVFFIAFFAAIFIGLDALFLDTGIIG